MLPVSKLRCLIAILICIIASATAEAQKGGKQKGMKQGQGNNRTGKGSRDTLLSENLPPSFRGLSNEDVQALTAVAKNARAWMQQSTIPDNALVLSTAEFSSKAEVQTDEGSQSLDTERLGLAILARLELAQRKQLATLLDPSLADKAAAGTFDNSVKKQFADIRELASLQKTRSAEAVLKKDAAEQGRRLGEALIRESRLFADVEKSLTAEQRDAILLTCRSGLVSSDAEPELRAADEELENSSPEIRSEMKQLAWRCGLWMSGGQLPEPTLSEEEVKELRKKNEILDPSLTSLLVLLTEPQHQELLQILKARVRSEKQSQNLCQSLVQSLQQLHGSRTLDERSIEQQAIQLVQTNVLSEYSMVSSFEAVRRSLTEAQQEYLGGSDAEKASDDEKPGNKKGGNNKPKPDEVE